MKSSRARSSKSNESTGEDTGSYAERLGRTTASWSGSCLSGKGLLRLHRIRVHWRPMTYLVDANVLSEPTKPDPAPRDRRLGEAERAGDRRRSHRSRGSQVQYPSLAPWQASLAAGTLVRCRGHEHSLRTPGSGHGIPMGSATRRTSRLRPSHSNQGQFDRGNLARPSAAGRDAKSERLREGWSRRLDPFF